MQHRLVLLYAHCYRVTYTCNVCLPRLAEKEATEAAAAAAAAAALAQEAAIDEQKAELRAAAALGAGATPYRAPGGRWGQFRRYSVWQRTFEIWSFAFGFLLRLWLSGKKFSYGKQARA